MVDVRFGLGKHDVRYSYFLTMVCAIFGYVIFTLQDIYSFLELKYVEYSQNALKTTKKKKKTKKHRKVVTKR